MSQISEIPRINDGSPLLKMEIPPVAIILIGSAGYLVLFAFVFLIRYFLRSKGSCQDDCCSLDGGPGCCQCIEACADACTCGTPTVEKMLDSCCPKRNLDCIGLILCQCCGGPRNPCCGDTDGPCCSYGDLVCNCACIQPDLDSVNCLCCQIGTSNYNRAELD